MYPLRLTLRRLRPGWVAALLTALTATGCATSLATMQPYETLRPGDFHIATGYAVQVPVSQTIRSIRASVELGSAILEHDSTDPVTDEEWAGVAASSFGVLLSAPYFDNEYAFRYGLVKNIDVGLRYAWSSLRLEGKFMLFRYKPTRRFDTGLSLNLGFGPHFFDGFVFDALDYVDMKFSRWDFEASAIYGFSVGTWDTLHVWMGPKVLWSYYRIKGSVIETINDNSMGLIQEIEWDITLPDDRDGVIQMYGGFLGAAVGYRWIWFMVELTVLWSIAKHRVLPDALTEKTDFGGLVISPSWGFMLRF